jgi:hypothetical protein
MNNVNSETSNRISSAIENLFRSRTVDLLQTLTFNQIDGQIKYALSVSDYDVFQKFHYMYLVMYNQELRRDLKNIYDGTSHIPSKLWARANDYIVYQDPDTVRRVP